MSFCYTKKINQMKERFGMDSILREENGQWRVGEHWMYNKL